MMEGTVFFDEKSLDVERVQQACERVKAQLAQVIVGQTETIDFLLVALFSGGHVLLEGVPGIAKTMTARLLAKTMASGFGRIQFTPDLMPADVTGASVFNLKTSEFTFKSGPIFANIILIDEINRAPAKTQAALFEAMEEKQVTVDGMTHKLGRPFFVMATQNPIEQEGTYKLPEAQLDRFLFKILMNYPDLADEKLILRRFANDFAQKSTENVSAVMTPGDIESCTSIIEQVFIREELMDYIATLVEHTRHNGDLALGASPRASLAILKASKAVAAMSGRAFVTPDDIRYVAHPVLNHRVILTPDREMEGMTTREVIDNILKKIEVPR
jgi:MoxR-like ATPase